MPKYKIDVTATVEVEAENVMLAKEAASGVKLIGQLLVGGKHLKNWRDSTRYRVIIADFEMSNPKRVDAINQASAK